MDKYLLNKEIGSGSFGKVFLVEAKQSGIQYVVKQIDLNKLDKKQSSTAPKEVEVLSKLKHNNIVRYKESFEENKNLNIVMEYCENGDLHKQIKEKRLKNECFTEDEILDYFVQICLALEYIHSERILHRDLKSKNIFLTKGNVIKLGDFGIAKVLENSLELAQTCIGSPFYISPEICENRPYDKKSDIWALGCVLYELSTLKYAFVAKNMKFLLTRIITGIYSPIPTHVNIQIRNLIAALLKPNPKDRPTVTSILKKPFLEKYVQKYSCEIKKTNLNRKRSKSGEALRNNFTNGSKNMLRERVLSTSCLKLNEPYRRNLTKPEMKYTPPVFPNRVNKSKFNKNNLNNAQKIKITKLPKVDSQYYNLIAENQQKKENNSGKCLDQKNFKSVDATPKFLVQEKEMFSEAQGNISDNLIKNEILATTDFHDNRKKWMANTFDREKLIEILSEADLINSSFSNTVLERKYREEKPVEKQSVDDMLRLDPSEITADVLLPIKIENCHKQEEEKINIDYYDLLKQEIKLLKTLYKENDGSYKLSDLVRLTENSRQILILHICQTQSEGKQKSESLYFNLELRRMELEKNVGFCLFLKTYRKMMSILNGDFTAEKERNVKGTETYTVSKSGDETDNLKKAWTDVIDLLEHKQKYLPDIWEFTISENLCYQE